MKDTILIHLGKEHLDELEALLKSISETQPKIVCTGLLNAGKSTLMNSLTGDFDNSRFPVADRRMTVSKQEFKHDNSQYIDTPGLDAKEEDTQLVLNSIKTADITLFVHNISTGELDAKEFEFLNILKNSWYDSSAFISNTIFVLSRRETVSDEDYEKNIHRIKIQITEIFGVEPIVVAVSSNSYQKAMRENKSALLKKSNMSVLKELIETVKNKKTNEIEKNKQQRLYKKVSSFIDKLELLRNEKETNKKTLDDEISKKKKALKNDVDKLNKILQTKYRNRLKL